MVLGLRFSIQGLGLGIWGAGSSYQNKFLFKEVYALCKGNMGLHRGYYWELPKHRV